MVVKLFQNYMDKFCSIIGFLCVIGGVICCCCVDLFSGFSLLTSGFLFLVLSQHLFNQSRLIKVIKESACPQLFYINLFAPTILQKKIIEEDSSFENSKVTIAASSITADGTFIVNGRASERKGFKVEYANFRAEFMPGEHYQLKSDWEIIKFDWV